MIFKMPILVHDMGQNVHKEVHSCTKRAKLCPHAYSQCARTDLNIRSLPKPMTTTG